MFSVDSTEKFFYWMQNIRPWLISCPDSVKEMSHSLMPGDAYTLHQTAPSHLGRSLECAANDTSKSNVILCPKCGVAPYGFPLNQTYRGVVSSESQQLNVEWTGSSLVQPLPKPMLTYLFYAQTKRCIGNCVNTSLGSVIKLQIVHNVHENRYTW